MENQNTVATENKPRFPSAFTLFGSSLSIIGRNFETFLALIFGPLVFVVLGVVLSFMATAFNSNGVEAGTSFVSFLLTLTTIALYFMVMPGLLVTQLRGAYDKSINPRDAFSTGLPVFWRLLGQSILLTLIYAIGLVLLIVPFFFLYKRYILAPYYLVQENLGIMESMRKSAEDSKRFSSPLWGLVGVSSLLNLISAIPFVGWILPLLYSCAPAARYKEIIDAKGASDEPATKVVAKPKAPETPAPSED